MFFEKCTRGPIFGAARRHPFRSHLPNQNQKQTFFSRPRALVTPEQVVAAWQWVNCYEEMTPAGKQLLRINLDETSVRTYSSPKPGLVSLSPKRRKARQAGLDVHPAGMHKQRACLTHVAFICDNTQVQAALPHVFIGNETVVPLYVLQRTAPHLHTNVRLWRRKSAWVDGDALKDIVRLLHAALQPFQGTFQPLLLWDAVKAHIKPDVLQCAGRLGIWVIIVPAKITWLLQPADTHCFANYKAYLRRKYVDLLNLVFSL